MSNSPLLRSRDVTLPCSIMWLADISVRTSQKRIRLSKCPEIIVDPAPSDVTRSLHDDPANFVSVPMKRKYLSDKINQIHLFNITIKRKYKMLGFR